MATLQNIRSKGPLLVIVIGLALFAFIAGDAWKVMQPHQAHDVGEVNGDALSAQEYQNLVEEYTEVVKLMRGVTALNDEQTNQVRDEVWRSYVNNKLIEKLQQSPDTPDAKTIASQIYHLALLSQRQLTPDELSAFLTESYNVLEHLQ